MPFVVSSLSLENEAALFHDPRGAQVVRDAGAVHAPGAVFLEGVAQQFRQRFGSITLPPVLFLQEIAEFGDNWKQRLLGLDTEYAIENLQ